MANDTVVRFRQPDAFQDALTELLREKARDLLRHAIEAEVETFLSQHAQRDTQGRREVVRNGFQPEREVLTGIGAVPVKVPKVRDRSGKGRVFHSALVPRYVRKAEPPRLLRRPSCLSRADMADSDCC
jgi:transposase-like protein